MTVTAIFETNNCRTWTTGSVSQVQTTLKTQEAMNPNTFKVIEIREGKSAGFNTSQYGKGLY
jgi:hypothetical protein